MDKNVARRRTLGVVLGGALGTAIGSGLTGFWDWVYLLDVPVRHGPAGFIGLGTGAVVGVVWGLLTAWPKSWSSGALLGGVVAGVVAFLPTYRDLAQQPSVLSFELLVAALMLAGAILAGLLLAGLFRGFVVVARRTYGPWGKADYRELTLVGVVGLALTWSLDHLDESMGSRRAILRQVHRHAQDQG